MKKIMLSTCTMIFVVTAFSQTQQGTVMVGADLANIGVNFQENNTQFSFNLNPKAGWFIRDNVAVGPEIMFGINTQKGATAIDYGVGVFGRKYFGDQTTNLAKTTKWLIEANAGISGTNLSGDDVEKTSTNGLGLGVGPGFAYFLNQNISLEALAKYNLTVGFGSSTTSNRLSVSLGFQIYFPERQARNMIENPTK